MLGKAKIKYIQSLGQKKHRDESGLFIAEGPKIVDEFLRTIPQQVQEVYAVKEWLNNERKSFGSVAFNEVSGEELERLSQLKTPHEVLAVVKKTSVASELNLKAKVTLVLDTIQDPGNLGTIIRIADWFGITQIICSDECADVYNPKVVQATMGSIARVSVMYADLLQWLEEHKAIRIYATTLEGKDISKMSRLQEGLILVGNESKGIDAKLLALANERITIPKFGKAESLNAAVATGIILSHLI